MDEMLEFTMIGHFDTVLEAGETEADGHEDYLQALDGIAAELHALGFDDVSVWGKATTGRVQIDIVTPFTGDERAMTRDLQVAIKTAMHAANVGTADFVILPGGPLFTVDEERAERVSA